MCKICNIHTLINVGMRSGNDDFFKYGQISKSSLEDFVMRIIFAALKCKPIHKNLCGTCIIKNDPYEYIYLLVGDKISELWRMTKISSKSHQIEIIKRGGIFECFGNIRCQKNSTVHLETECNRYICIFEQKFFHRNIPYFMWMDYDVFELYGTFYVSSGSSFSISSLVGVLLIAT
jgi:hypothetical protein